MGVQDAIRRAPRRVPFAFGLLAVGTAALLGTPLAGAAPDRPPPATQQIQILSFNDFHGNLQPPAGSSGQVVLPDGTRVDAGGVEYLATHLRALEAENPNTAVVSAGDLIGASPLLSALFHDEPTIEAMNAVGLDLNGVGNHEFDEGWRELRRMQRGGCHPVDGCQDGDGFTGSRFKVLAANGEFDDGGGRTLFPPYRILDFDGTKIAFIGMTLEGTPSIVTPTGVEGLSFLDEADTANRYARFLADRGIHNIFVLLHEGGVPTGFFDECPAVSGPLVDIVDRMDPEIDAVISGHTHQGYNCEINGKLVTSSLSFGRLVTDIDITVDRATRRITEMAARNLIVTRDVAPASDMTALIARYNEFAGPIANRVVGSITGDITRAPNAAGESQLGDVIADAQLSATAPPDLGGSAAAFMNPGGIRADLVFDQQSGNEAPGEVTYGEAFTVQPFGNSLVVMTLTGAQIDTLLEQQWCGQDPAFPRILQPSEGFTYTWDAAAPVCDRVDASTIAIDGVPVDPAGSYRITVNSFLAAGGDNFPVLPEGTDRLGGDVDLDALEAYVVANSPVPPGPQDRITRLN